MPISALIPAALLSLATLLALPATAGTPAPELPIGVARLPTPPEPGGYVRTPEGIELALIQDLARHAKATPVLQAADPLALAGNPSTLGTRLSFARVSPDSQPPSGVVHTPLQHVIHPMAIMRTDTDIRQWTDLRNRTVCVVEGNPWTGRMQEWHGAQEQVYDTPTQALIAVRVGECDAMVHDDRFLDALLAFPEWQKFSAQLRDTQSLALVLVTATDDSTSTRMARQLARQWQQERRLETLLKTRAQEIAFEVYLEQDAVDCH